MLKTEQEKLHNLSLPFPEYIWLLHKGIFNSLVGLNTCDNF